VQLCGEKLVQLVEYLKKTRRLPKFFRAGSAPVGFLSFVAKPEKGEPNSGIVSRFYDVQVRSFLFG
jgi:hypothetical protein